MRLPIRWKLVLAVVFPAVLIYASILTLGWYRLRMRAVDRLQETATSIAYLYSTRLDAQLEVVAQIARSSAAGVALQPGMSEADLNELLKTTLSQSDLVHATSAVLEVQATGSGDPAGPLLLVRHQRDELPESFTANRTELDGPRLALYREATRLGTPRWTGPFLHEETKIPICRYAVPFLRGGVPGGVVTVEIGLRDLRRQVGPLHPEAMKHAIVNQEGVFLSHPDPAFVFQESLFSLARRHDRPDIEAVGQRVISGERGVVRHRSINDGAYEWIFFAPVPSTGWSFLASAPESAVLAFANSQLRRGLVFMAVGLLLLVACLLWVAARITRPVTGLLAAVGQLSRGNLDIDIEGTDRGDEIGGLARSFKKMTRSLKSHIEALTLETAAREAVESDLRLAREIQKMLLPKSFPYRKEFDLHAVNIPAKQVAGDFFDFFFTSEETLVVVMADVAGKGAPAALLMAMARTVVRNESLKSHSPGETLKKVNQVLNKEDLQQMFVTMFIAWYNTRTGLIQYANAGHPIPYRIGGDGHAAQFGESTGMVLGIRDGEDYANREEVLEVGEEVVLYTDGITEAVNGVGRFFGETGMAASLTDHASEPTQGLCENVAREVQEFQNHERQDDITILALKRVR